jgi:pimeloyl-ACP methyl ester carboxylesterase
MSMKKNSFVSGVGVAAILITALLARGENAMSKKVERKTCQAPDGVTIVYSVCGSGEPALIFIHGGLADRSFWTGQLEFFSTRGKTIALDLAGHGESGRNRTKWGLPEFGADIKAVVDAEKLGKVVIVGNSLGGPAAIEGALVLPGRAVGVIGVDTFQDLGSTISRGDANQRAELFQRDFAGGVKQMVKMLFHTDADPALMADAERRMAASDPKAMVAMFRGLAGYDTGAAARKLTVPLRAVNGDLYPTNIAAIRKVKPDFDAVVLPHMGHYPMLERPDEFNKRLAEVIEGLAKVK